MLPVRRRFLCPIARTSRDSSGFLLTSFVDATNMHSLPRFECHYGSVVWTLFLAVSSYCWPFWIRIYWGEPREMELVRIVNPFRFIAKCSIFLAKIYNNRELFTAVSSRLRRLLPPDDSVASVLVIKPRKPPPRAELHIRIIMEFLKTIFCQRKPVLNHPSLAQLNKKEEQSDLSRSFKYAVNLLDGDVRNCLNTAIRMNIHIL